MKRELVRIGVPVILAFGTCLSCSPGNGSGGSGATSAGSAQPPPPPPKPTLVVMAPPAWIPGQHAQSPRLRNGGLEIHPFFYGSLDANGRIVAAGVEAGKIQAAVPDGDKFKAGAILDLQPRGSDPCVRYNDRTTPVADLPLYLVTDDAGHNLCHGEVIPAVDADELARCGAGESDVQRQIDAFQRVQELAVAVSGYWDEKGKYFPTGSKVDEQDVAVITLACISGVIAKCAHWGYVPWKNIRDTSDSLAPYHQACVLAARADYGANRGDHKPTGDAHTCGSTVVDVFDQIHIQDSRSGNGIDLESYWNAAGRVCLTRPRYTGCNGSFGVEPNDCASAPSWLIGINSRTETIKIDGGEVCPSGKSDVPYCDYRQPLLPP